jgi:ABC-type branched-subunit amino acid transport system ATPase component
MFTARNATRTLKRNPRFTNLTTSRTFHTSLTNLNKMSEETKQQIKTAFPELLNIAKQKTTLPGREKDMTPIAKHTELECVASLVKIRQSSVGTSER